MLVLMGLGRGGSYKRRVCFSSRASSLMKPMVSTQARSSSAPPRSSLTYSGCRGSNRSSAGSASSGWWWRRYVEIRSSGLRSPPPEGPLVSPSGQSGGAQSDLDHQELLSQRFRQCLPPPLQHHAGEPLQVSWFLGLPLRVLPGSRWWLLWTLWGH